MYPEVNQASEMQLIMQSEKAQVNLSEEIRREKGDSQQSTPGSSTTVPSESAMNTPLTPAPKVLYRFIVRNGDEDDVIIDKVESDQPIQYEAPKIEIAAPSKQTLLEVVTTKVTSSGQQRTITTTDTKLKIHSGNLINALRELISYYPGLSLDNEIVEINEPYQPLVHYMGALENYKQNQPKEHNPETVVIVNDEIDTLLEVSSNLIAKEVEVERERHQRNPPVCTWNYAWMLFPPGTLAWIRRPHKDPKAVIIASVKNSESANGSVLFCAWHVVYDSDMRFSILEEIYMLDFFEGEKEISHLFICPNKWSNIPPEIVEEQTKSGRIYAELFKPCYKEYLGQVADGSELQIRGKVMVDHYAWIKDLEKFTPRLHRRYIDRDLNQAGEEGCQCVFCYSASRKPKVVPAKDWPHDPARPETLKVHLPDEFYLLCDSKIGGYALHERKWVSLQLNGIADPIIEDAPFDNLVLEAETKSTIEALVWNYVQEDTKVKAWSIDFIQNKGEGRIFLLHGSPGVGKTCTAECVADLIRRPLLSLTCGDMGITAGEVESNFKEFIDLGERWGAVVLMDEADVYLEQRTAENLQRNSLVSVFLRTLEYFRGILFLTTNRVGSFDDAFISRIHVALHYKTLTEEHRKKIWEKNFNRLNKEGNVTIDTATIIYAVSDPDVVAVKWNGREIRNGFQTAVALAQFEARKAGLERVILKVEHLKRVVMMSKQFKDYITSTHKNQDETKRARIQESRNDDFHS